MRLEIKMTSTIFQDFKRFNHLAHDIPLESHNKSAPPFQLWPLWPIPAHPRAKVPSWECHTSQRYLQWHNLGFFSYFFLQWMALEQNTLTSTDLNPAIKPILLWVFEIGRNVLEFSTETNVALTEGKATKRQPSCQPLRSPQERFWCLGTCEARCAVMASPAAPFLGIGCIGCIGCWPLLATREGAQEFPSFWMVISTPATCKLPTSPCQAALAQGKHHRIHAPNLCLRAKCLLQIQHFVKISWHVADGAYQHTLKIFYPREHKVKTSIHKLAYPYPLVNIQKSMEHHHFNG